MDRGSSLPSRGPGAEKPGAGLPRVSYYPPVVATLLAAVFIFMVVAALALIMVGNTLRLWGGATGDASGDSIFTAGLCGIASLALIGGALYLFSAIIKGLRDLGAQVYYTRGTVVEQAVMKSRKASPWLLVDPAYSGPDVYQASIVTDEQKASSVDRSQIVEPRGMKGFSRFGAGRRSAKASVDSELEAKLASASKPSGYLSPERISASTSQTARTPHAETGDNAPKPHVIFRSDFASRAQLRGGEEVIVAHSPYLQHTYYIARLLNGEWEVYKNKALV